MKWDNAADRKLLLTILDLYKVNIDWKQLAAKFGNDCGPRSVYIRVQKLRKEYEAESERFPRPSTLSSKSQKGKRIQESFDDDDEYDGGNVKRERGTRDRSVIPKREPGVHVKEEGGWEDSMEGIAKARGMGIRRRPNSDVQPAQKEWRGQVIVIDD